MARKLVRNVRVDREWYGPAYGNEADVPKDVADKITNPAAWEEEEKPRRSRKADSESPSASGEG